MAGILPERPRRLEAFAVPLAPPCGESSQAPPPLSVPRRHCSSFRTVIPSGCSTAAWLQGMNNGDPFLFLPPVPWTRAHTHTRARAHQILSSASPSRSFSACVSLSGKSLASCLLRSRPVSKEVLGDSRLCDLFMEPVASVT